MSKARPDGVRRWAESTVIQFGTAEGERPRDSNSLSARVESVTAALVAGEHCSVDDRDRVTGTRESERGRRPSGPGSDDENPDAFGLGP